MFAVESLILTALIALAAGVGLGMLVGRNGGHAKHQQDLEKNLVKVKEELDSYQQDVAKHFMDTAKKVGELTQSYRELNQHLAEGAMRLTSTEITQNLLAASENQLSPRLNLENVEPPKDWAPKIPGRHGMLSEEFGLKDTDNDDAIAPLAADTDEPARR